MTFTRKNKQRRKLRKRIRQKELNLLAEKRQLAAITNEMRDDIGRGKGDRLQTALEFAGLGLGIIAGLTVLVPVLLQFWFWIWMLCI